LRKRTALFIDTDDGKFSYFNLTARETCGMDNIDLSILRCLKENSRQTASMISQTINLSVSAVIERIRKMETKGIIQKYTIMLDEKQMGNDLTVFISVSLEHSKQSPEFAEAALAHAQVAECYCIAGDVDYLLKIVVNSSHDLEVIHREIKEMPGVSRTKTQYVLSTLKRDISVVPEE